MRWAMGLFLAGCVATRPDATEKVADSKSVVELQLIAINDFHGHLMPPEGTIKTPQGAVEAGGVAYLASHVAALRKKYPNTLVVSAGDLIGGSPLLSALFHDEPTIEAMDLLGLDINALGNHELDEGADEILRIKNGGCHPVDGCQGKKSYPGAKLSFLAANTRRDQQTATLFPPYEIRSVGGVQVAFIGMTLEGTAKVIPPSVRGLRFADEADTANSLVLQLQAKGVQAIVVLLHEGGFQKGGYDGCEDASGPIVKIVERMHPAIDLVITGHTHQAYNCVISGRRVTSAGSFGRWYTQLLVRLDPASQDVLSVTAENRVVTHDVEPDATEKELIARYGAIAAPIGDRVVGRLGASLERNTNSSGESVLGNVIADAHLEAMRPDGAVAAFMNSGGIRMSLRFQKSAGETEDGQVTYGELFAVHPFGNRLLVVSLTGAQILEVLEDQFYETESPRTLQVSHTVRYAWDPAAPRGSRVVPGSVQIEGKPLELQQSYKIVLNDFLAARGVLAQGKDPAPGPLDVEALEAYLQRHAPLTPPPVGRITRR